MRGGPRLVACIPAYNEEKTIGCVVRETRRYVDIVIVCDDGSSDRTSEEAARAGAIVIRHEKNMGYGAALRTLFLTAKRLNPDAMVILDADGQHNPADIPRLVKAILAGEADVVVGSRLLRDTDMPVYRAVGVRLITWPIRAIAYPRLKDAQSGFRAYSRRAVRLIDVTERGMGASTEILLKSALYDLVLKEVPVRINYAGITHKMNPWIHGIQVFLVTIKHIIIYLIRKLLRGLNVLLWRRSNMAAGVYSAI